MYKKLKLVYCLHLDTHMILYGHANEIVPWFCNIGECQACIA